MRSSAGSRSSSRTSSDMGPEMNESESLRNVAALAAADVVAATGDDAALASLAAQGDQDAFARIMRRYNQRLYRLAVSVMGDASEAEDVLQESYVRAFYAFATYAGRRQPRRLARTHRAQRSHRPGARPRQPPQSCRNRSRSRRAVRGGRDERGRRPRTRAQRAPRPAVPDRSAGARGERRAAAPARTRDPAPA